MKDKLNRIREPKPAKTGKKKSAATRNTILITLLGIALGMLSKWLDNIAFDDTVWWHHPIEVLDLGNVFSEFGVWLLLALAISIFSRTPARAALNTFLFFAGMCAAYHIYTILFSGFAPNQYMMIWYAITLVSPVLAVICWYGKGDSAVSIVIDVLIVAVMAVSCFGIGWFYFDPRSAVYLLIFVASIAVLYRSPKQCLISLAGGIALSFFLEPYIPYL